MVDTLGASTSIQTLGNLARSEVQQHPLYNLNCFTLYSRNDYLDFTPKQTTVNKS